MEDGAAVYEATWVDGGRRHEATVTVAGHVLEHDVEVPVNEVPSAVRAAAEKELGFEVRYERQMDGRWEAEAMVGGKEVEIEIEADGRVVGGNADADRGDEARNPGED